jgi:hypothetical protein
VIYVGAAILGRVGGDMIVSDPWIENWLEPSRMVAIGIQAFFAVAVLAVGRLLVKRQGKAGA